MDIAGLITELRPLLADAVVATDFDGTLAPLVKDPQQSRPVDGAVAALTALTRRGAHVAVITGRDAATVLRLGSLHEVPDLIIEGLYGLETWEDGALRSPETPQSMHALRERLPDVLEDAGADPEVWIEDKRLSLVVHTRRAGDPDAQLTLLRSPVGELAENLGLELHAGSQVLEVRLPGYDKAGALTRLVEQFHPRAVLFLGDDLGDLSAFAEITRLREGGLTAYSVGVRSSDVADVAAAADVPVEDPHAVAALLTELAAAR